MADAALSEFSNSPLKSPCRFCVLSLATTSLSVIVLIDKVFPNFIQVVLSMSPSNSHMDFNYLFIPSFLIFYFAVLHYNYNLLQRAEKSVSGPPKHSAVFKSLRGRGSQETTVLRALA